MDLFGIVGACVRRWYVMLPLVAVTGFFAFQSYQSVESSYRAAASVVVLPSVEATSGQVSEEKMESSAGNPYSGQGGSRFAVAVLGRNINSSTFGERLDLPAGSSVEAVPAASQAILLIEATAGSPDEVYGLLERATAEAGAVLNEVQAIAGAPESTRYRLAPAVPAGDVEDVTPSRLRTAGAILVVGLGISAALVTALDALLKQRKRHRKVAPEVLDPDDPDMDSDSADSLQQLPGPVRPRLERKPNSELTVRRSPRLGLPKVKPLSDPAPLSARPDSGEHAPAQRSYTYNSSPRPVVPNRTRSPIDPGQ